MKNFFKKSVTTGTYKEKIENLSIKKKTTNKIEFITKLLLIIVTIPT